MYSAAVINELKKNTPLRLKLALALGISEAGVLRAIKKNSNSITRHSGVVLIKQELGLNDEEIFAKETSTQC